MAIEHAEGIARGQVGTADEEMASVGSGPHVDPGSDIDSPAAVRQWEDLEGHPRVGSGTVESHPCPEPDRCVPLYVPTRQQEETTAALRHGNEPIADRFALGL
jgi:hypothetical protein